MTHPTTLLASRWILMLVIGLCARVGSGADLGVAQAQCERRVNPLGVDVRQPRFSWTTPLRIVLNQTVALVPEPRAARQSAYQILVASDPELLKTDKPDLWDSGKVASTHTQQIFYEGQRLAPSQKVFWKVRVWDPADAPSDWSDIQTFTMGLLDPADWKARWITAPGLDAPLDKTRNYASTFLRREFEVKSGLTRAVVHVSGLGHYEMQLNGEKVGNDLLTPGWSTYNKTVLYDTHDITPMLAPGKNVAGMLLGAGMYQVEKPEGRYTKLTSAFGAPKAIMQIRLEYRDGSSELILTDEDWTTHAGPITFSHVYGGEDFDARLNPPGWSKPGFPTTDWQPAVTVPGPGGVLTGLSASNPPIRTFEAFKPVAVRELHPGVTVFDFGQNASVIPRLTVKGQPGARVKIVPGETLKRDGTVSQTAGGGPSFWTYTLAGNGSETYFPKFFYRGSRYEQVELSPAPDSTELPVIESIETVVLHADAQPAGTFECSNELFNRIYPLVRWAQRSNTFSVLTDCPHREKLGWLEQTYLNGPSLRYNFDLAAFFAKTMNDIADAQTEIGMVPGIAPEYVKFGGDKDTNSFRNSPEWGSAIVLAAWQQYVFHGDSDLLAKHYDAMKRYVAYLGTKSNGHILDFGLGDWYDLGPKAPGPAQLTPRALTATATYYADVTTMAQIAKLLGKREDAAAFETLGAQIRTAFNARFFNPESGTYSTNSQCANAMPLVLGMVDEANRKTVLEAIIKDIQQRGLSAGDVGYRYLLRALADNGRSDVIYAMNNQSDKPGYGMQLKRGATSLTEAWDGGNSQNHFMLGQINEWFFHDLAGIQPDPSAPGFAKIIIKPAIVAGMEWTRASYASQHGLIRSAWNVSEGMLTLDVSIPPGTTATVFIPASAVESVTETGVPLKSAKGVSASALVDNTVRCQIESGTYQFRVKR